MKHLVGKWGSVAKRLLIANLFMGVVFATIYYYISLAVTRGLIQRSLRSDRKDGAVSLEVTSFIKNNPRGLRLLKEVDNNERTFYDQIIKPIMKPDFWLQLDTHHPHNWLWWFLRSMMIQSGMGADMGNVSNKNSIFQIIQIIEVLIMNAYVISL